ncbi:unnamed protein product [Cylindrotheca closterium]|uniref:Uncharacterized protein n=1 Tax=Cylindrotheca closterium TaxID=2856 RepID=A0AAD2JMP1_9STRA|nr:unnamed protein product [Cylindrotheca closterium]CAJ1965519.1 unnamed protein product [Cylindrotheca closterium]
MPVEEKESNRASIKRKQLAKLLCCLICCLVPGAIIWGVANLQVQDLEYAKGTVVATTYCGYSVKKGVDYNNGKRDHYNITFRFELVSNGTTVNATTEDCTGSVPSLGTVETILYDPEDPTDIVQNSTFQTYQAVGIGLAALGLVCSLVLVTTVLLENRHAGGTSKHYSGTAPGSDPIVLQSHRAQGNRTATGYYTASGAGVVAAI